MSPGLVLFVLRGWSHGCLYKVALVFNFSHFLKESYKEHCSTLKFDPGIYHSILKKSVFEIYSQHPRLHRGSFSMLIQFMWDGQNFKLSKSNK